MEASALQAPVGLTRSKISIGSPLLRLRSDEQLVTQFREGDEEAFRVIHDRYRQRLFAYSRQMLPCRQDAEDALQDVFVRAYAGLRAHDGALALRAWLYRIAHNRCVDELRRPPQPAPETIELTRAPVTDPMAKAEERESLRRLIADLRRLPDQQRSALLMRELSGMSYLELADALGISVAAVKSVLVRARVSLTQSVQARETACAEIQEELILAHDRRVRPNATARRHLRDCAPCREFRRELRGVSRQLAALAPTLGPAGVVMNLLGGGGGAAAAGSGSCAGTSLLTSSAAHVATLLAAAAVTAGGAVELQRSLAGTSQPPRAHSAARPASVTPSPAPLAAVVSEPAAQVRTASTNAVARTAVAPPPVSPAPASRPPVSYTPAPPPPSSPASDLGSTPAQGATLSVAMGPGPLATPDQASSNTDSDPAASAGTSTGSDGSTSSTAARVPANGSSTKGSQDVSTSGTSARSSATTQAGGTYAPASTAGQSAQ